MTTEEQILKLVNESTGIKATELVARMDDENLLDFQEVVNKLVKEDKIIEMEYTVPNLSWRLKSMYFPAGSMFKFSDELV